MIYHSVGVITTRHVLDYRHVYSQLLSISVSYNNTLLSAYFSNKFSTFTESVNDDNMCFSCKQHHSLPLLAEHKYEGVFTIPKG